MSRTTRSRRWRRDSKKTREQQVRQFQTWIRGGATKDARRAEEREQELEREIAEDLARRDDLLFYVIDEFTGIEDLATRWAGLASDYDDNTFVDLVYDMD
jgi:hypothetical protein